MGTPTSAPLTVLDISPGLTGDSLISAVNDRLRRISEVLNTGGSVSVDLNMTGHRITNLADAAGPSDALNLKTADSRYGPRTVQGSTQQTTAPSTSVSAPGPPGAVGPAGLAGATGATGPGVIGTVAPNITSATALVSYFDNAKAFNINGVITLPTGDPAYSHLDQIVVMAFPPTSATGIQIAVLPAPYSGATVDYAGLQLPMPDADEAWSVEFICLNEYGNPAPSPYTLFGIHTLAVFVSSVAAADIGPRYQDATGQLHTVLQITPTFSNPVYPAQVSMWIDYDDGTGIHYWGGNPFTIAAPGDSFIVGEQTVGTSGVKDSGPIWVPTNVNAINWRVWLVANWVAQAIPPIDAVSVAFVVAAVDACPPNSITGAQFNTNPATGDILTYGIALPGVYFWGFYQLQLTLPSITQDPNFWFAGFTLQKGVATTGVCSVASAILLTRTSGPAFTAGQVGYIIHVGGVATTILTFTDANHVTLASAVSTGSGQAYEVWNPAPDFEGINDDLTLYNGRWVGDVGSMLGSVSPDTPATVSFLGDSPPDWGDPPGMNVDGSANIYRSYRFWIYAISRLGTEPGQSAATSVYTLQTTCWPTSADHFDVTPAVQPPALDLTQTNPNSTDAHFGVSGGKFSILPSTISTADIASAAVTANKMAAAAITQANAALAANAVVDSNVLSVGVSKLISGTNIFTGDVILSRGSSQPVIDLSNIGIFLYGVASLAGNVGLATNPYVAIQSTGVSVFSGLTGPSVVVTSAAVTLFSATGSVGFPYVQLTSSGISLVASTFTAQITAAQIFLSKSGGATLALNASGLKITDGTYSLVMSGSFIQLWSVDGNSAFPCLGVSTNLINFTAGSNSLLLSPTQIQLVATNATMSLSSSDFVMTVPGQLAPVFDLFGSASTTGITLQTNSGNTNAQLFCGSSSVQFTLDNGIAGTHCMIKCASGSPFLSFNGTQVITTRQTGPGNPSFGSLGDAQTWASNLLTALRTHGLVT